MAPDIDLDQPLNIVHHGLWMRLARHRYCNICQPASPLSAASRGRGRGWRWIPASGADTGPYKLASFELVRSVISIEPGA